MESLASRLQQLRNSLGWTLSYAEQETGMSRRTLRRFEDGTRRPTHGQLQQFAEKYGDLQLLRYAPPERPRGRRIYGEASAELRATFAFRPPLLLVPSVEVAYRAATGYETGKTLLHRLLTRRGQHPNRWRAIKLVAHELNGVELVAVLHLLELGAEIAAVSPHQLGFMAPLVQQAHRPILALYLTTNDVTVAFFPQLGVETRRGACPQLDFLVGTVFNKQRTFLDVELDGPGHRDDKDKEREKDLQLPTVRYPWHHVDRMDFGQRLIADCISVAQCQTQRKTA